MDGIEFTIYTQHAFANPPTGVEEDGKNPSVQNMSNALMSAALCE